MRAPVKIRESTEYEKESIKKVHREAFGEPEGEAVSQLAVDLLEDETAMPVLSLVAEHDSEIIGSIIFSTIKVGGVEDTSAYILCPLAVSKAHQGTGVGMTLINQGLQVLGERGAKFVLVLGDPSYYSRAGFKSDHNLSPPYTIDYPEAWMARELVDNSLEKVKGVVQCASSLSSPEHW